MQVVSLLSGNCMECQSLFSEKQKKKKKKKRTKIPINLSSAEFAQRVIRVDDLGERLLEKTRDCTHV